MGCDDDGMRSTAAPFRALAGNRALLRAVSRTAPVTARTEAEVYADREARPVAGS